jgi:hypothetical protein
VLHGVPGDQRQNKGQQFLQGMAATRDHLLPVQLSGAAAAFLAIAASTENAFAGFFSG